MRKLVVTSMVALLGIGALPSTAVAVSPAQAPAAVANTSSAVTVGAQGKNSQRAGKKVETAGAVLKNHGNRIVLHTAVRADLLRDSRAKLRKGRADVLRQRIAVLPLKVQRANESAWVYSSWRRLSAKRDGIHRSRHMLTPRQQRIVRSLTRGSGHAFAQRRILIVTEHIKHSAKTGSAHGPARGARGYNHIEVDAETLWSQPRRSPGSKTLEPRIAENRGTTKTLMIKNETAGPLTLIASPVQCMYGGDLSGGFGTSDDPAGLQLINGSKLNSGEVLVTEVASEADGLAADAEKEQESEFRQEAANAFASWAKDVPEPPGTGIDMGYFGLDAAVATAEFIGMDVGEFAGIAFGDAVPVFGWAVALGTGLYDIFSGTCNNAASYAMFGAIGYDNTTGEIKTSQARYLWDGGKLSVDAPRKAITIGLEQGRWSGWISAGNGKWGNFGADGTEADPNRSLSFYDDNFPDLDGPTQVRRHETPAQGDRFTCDIDIDGRWNGSHASSLTAKLNWQTTAEVDWQSVKLWNLDPRNAWGYLNIGTFLNDVGNRRGVQCSAALTAGEQVYDTRQDVTPSGKYTSVHPSGRRTTDAIDGSPDTDSVSPDRPPLG